MTNEEAAEKTVTLAMSLAWSEYLAENPLASYVQARREVFMAGYEAGARKSTPAHSPGFDTDEERPTRFVNEWNHMVSEVSTFASKWDLPKPQMIFHPKWLNIMGRYGNVSLAPTIIYMDVKIRFGMFEPADVLRIAG